MYLRVEYVHARSLNVYTRSSYTTSPSEIIANNENWNADRRIERTRTC